MATEFKFPNNVTNFPHLLFRAYEYHMPTPDESNAEKIERSGPALCQVRLYIPPGAGGWQLDAIWENSSAVLVGSSNKTGEAAGSIAGAAANNINFASLANEGLKSLSSALLGKEVAGADTAFNTVYAVKGARQMPSEISIFKGNTPEQFNFQFEFDPESKKEALDVNKILLLFKTLTQGYMGKIGGETPVFMLGFPPLWDIELIPASSSTTKVTNKSTPFEKKTNLALQSASSTVGEGSEFSVFENDIRFPTKSTLSLNFVSLYPPYRKGGGLVPDKDSTGASNKQNIIDCINMIDGIN